MGKMEALARSHVWCPHIDKDIEGAAQHCGGCHPKLTPLHPWEFPDGLWRRIYMYMYVEFGIPFQGKSFLVIVNAYSKWRLWQWMKPPQTGQWMNCMLTYSIYQFMYRILVVCDG